jgi:hypothetical protein
MHVTDLPAQEGNSSRESSDERFDVVVVGGGQAGLAIGYFLGLTWQHTRGSALIGWVKDDADFIAEQIAGVAATQARRERETSETIAAPRPAAVTEGA